MSQFCPFQENPDEPSTSASHQVSLKSIYFLTLNLMLGFKHAFAIKQDVILSLSFINTLNSQLFSRHFHIFHLPKLCYDLGKAFASNESSS